LVAQFVNDLYSSLSRVRLETYRPANGDDLDMLTNYFWNIDLAEALIPSLHAAELALRNTIHDTLTQHFGTEMWFYERGLLEPGQLVAFAQALAKVAKKPQPHARRLVAQLTFGFWATLLNAPYEHRVWQPNGFALKLAAFPHATKAWFRSVFLRSNLINGINWYDAHYEPLWNRSNLLQKHADIHEAIAWINPTLHRAIQSVDDFPSIFHGRSQVEARLRQHLAIP